MTNFILGLLAAWIIISILITYSNDHDLGIAVEDINVFSILVLAPITLIPYLFGLIMRKIVHDKRFGA